MSHARCGCMPRCAHQAKESPDVPDADAAGRRREWRRSAPSRSKCPTRSSADLRRADQHDQVARPRDGSVAGCSARDDPGTCQRTGGATTTGAAFEARFAALPHFITEIDGVDIHFIHARSKHDDALPLIVTHGWPGSTIEQLKIIEPLTDPTAHGADAADAFHLVIPSLPGHGFSGSRRRPAGTRSASRGPGSC